MKVKRQNSKIKSGSLRPDGWFRGGEFAAAFDGLLLVSIAALLIWPLFRVQYFDNWMSIDGAFIGDIRFLSRHLPSPGWVPYFYCGNRYDYLYPPAMRYGAALLVRYGGWSAAQAYHIYSALLYCLGAAGAYALMRAAGGGRKPALAAGAAWLVCSPVLMIFPGIRQDSALAMPQRLNVIVRWGEVPHMSALSTLLFALAAGWIALRGGRPGMLALSAVLCALAVSNNFYGATALAVFFALMVWTLWLAYGGAGIWARAAAITALSYALTACWLTPSYLALTARNLKLVAEPGNTPSRLLVLGSLAAFGAISYRLGRRRPERAWPIFLAGALACFGLSSVAGFFFHFHALGEPTRFVPEFDLLLILAAVESVRREALPARVCGGLLLGASLAIAFPYLRHPWAVYEVDAHPERRIEYRLAQWLAEHLPGSRVHIASSLGFWSYVWHDVTQVGGISDQGMQNQTIALANWQILFGDKPERDIHFLQALGADAIVVHGERSQEIYHAMRFAHKFDGRLPVLFDSGEDDIVYRVPRRFPGLARVVDRRRAESLAPIPWSEDDEAQLRAYAEMLEQGPDAAAASEWVGWRSMLIRAQIREGESIVVQENYDPAWRASIRGRRLPIHKDAMGFMRIDAPAGDQEIYLDFRLPLENRIGRAVTLAALAAVVWLFARAVYVFFAAHRRPKVVIG
jgi:hypothetical protein